MSLKQIVNCDEYIYSVGQKSGLFSESKKNFFTVNDRKVFQKCCPEIYDKTCLSLSLNMLCQIGINQAPKIVLHLTRHTDFAQFSLNTQNIDHQYIHTVSVARRV